MENILHKIFRLLALAEKLKCELRHCDLSTGRRESVADSLSGFLDQFLI